MSTFTALPDYPVEVPASWPMDEIERAALLDAAQEVRRCQQALAKAGLNVVGELLRGHDGFYEMNHYPDDDVYDRDSHAQYYYHAHREGTGEHGHFHTFLRGPGMPGDLQRQSEQAIAHLIAVSMDAWGQPIGLFACNRWVTAKAGSRPRRSSRCCRGFASITPTPPGRPTCGSARC